MLRTLAIEEFCKTGSGTTPSRSNPLYYDAGTIPWVKSGELRENVILDTEEKVTVLALRETSLKLIPSGAILVALYGATVGRSALLGIEATTNQAVCHIITDKKEADTQYLFHCLQYKVPELISRAVGGAQPNISQNTIRQLRVPLPPLPEQRRIAAILDAADALRAKRRAALGKLDALLQAVFLEMFGDPVRNERGWPIAELKDVCVKITDGTHQPPKWAISGIPFLFVSNVVGGQLNFDTKKFISLETYEELHRRSPIELGDILYTIVGSYGNAAMVETERRFSFQRHIAHLKPDTKKVLPAFLLGMLQSSGVKRQVDTLVRGIAQKTLNLRELKEVKVLLPDLKAQERYCHIKANLNFLYQQQSIAINELDLLFISIQQRAFRGEL